MFKLALVFPLRYKKFYINPLILQKLQSMLHVFLAHNKIDIYLFDVNCENIWDKTDTKEFDLAIVDTPEGSILDVFSALDHIRAKAILLVGDNITYGKSIEIIRKLSSDLSTKVYGVTEDIDAIIFVKRYLEDGYIEDGTRMLAFPDADRNALLKTQAPMEKYKLEFPKWILDLYDKKGIQIFMDGLSRGCENTCSFCKLSNVGMSSVKCVKNSCVDVVETIRAIEKQCPKRLYIQFVDENFFGGGLTRLLEIRKLCDGLTAIQFGGLIGIDTRLDTIINPKDTNEIALLRESTWELLSECGLKYCFIGIETFSSSQAERYNKRLDLSQFDRAIAMLEKLNIRYTVGLIMWDPLMDKNELLHNLRFIEERSLLGKTASLLKCLRVQVNSQYFGKYKNMICEKGCSSDYFNIDEDDIHYYDDGIQKILPFVRYVYNLFSHCGYRHSDVACFGALFDEKTPPILKDIPYRIAWLEYETLQYLLKLEYSFQDDAVYCDLRAKSRTVVDVILTELKVDDAIYDSSIEINTIRQYYLKVFNRISLAITTLNDPTELNVRT